MARVLVIADDLTGANASAAGFARSGFRAVTVGLGRRWDAIAEFHNRFDVIVATTETRHSSPADAAAAVTGAVRAGWPFEFVSSRIDTTLRGNVGVATEALLRTAGEVTGRRVVGLCLPGHPDAGRQTVDGIQLLNGVRLEETELAHDARSPVHTSSVSEVLRSGTHLTTALIPLSVVTSAHESVVEAVRDAVRGGADVVIGDALTLDHLDRLAQAAAAVLSTEDILWAGVDPGPGSLALAGALGIHGSDDARPLLAISGSATAVTTTQLQRLIASRPVHVVRPVYGEESSLDVDRTGAALIQALGEASAGQVVLLATALVEGDVRQLNAGQAERLPRSLGLVARRVLQETEVAGLYTTGGDITAAVLQAIGGRGIEIEDEILPLAVAGEVVDGPWSGLTIVTKGGLVGDSEAAMTCLDHLARSASQRVRRVRSAIPREPYFQSI